MHNTLLFGYGIWSIAAAIVCLALIYFTHVRVNGINAFIKPAKFFASIAIFCISMSWILQELNLPTTIHYYSFLVVVVMSIEMIIIVWQAANGRLSHFNTSKPLYAMLFVVMGIAISILTIAILWIGILFFGDHVAPMSVGYLWGIRLGIILFVVFAFQGGLMGGRLRHTVGGEDDSEGLPIVNWSKRHGDLRIAHFVGMHALQLLPLAGFYVFTSAAAIIAFAAVYATFVVYTLVNALRGLPFTGRVAGNK